MDDPSTPFSEAAARVRDGADPHREAAAIVREMTHDELLGCLDGDTPFWPGLVDMSTGGYYRHPWPAAQVPRVGVPGIEFADGPRGAVIADGTAFPVSMGRGATFDPDLEEQVGEAIGAELRAAGATFTGAVCLNLLRHPAWGRAQETYGEDPHHVGEMAAALTRGLQRHVLACMKHFALNSMENARFRVDVRVDERTLHEVYLPHFRRVAAEGVASTMSAYNRVNGEWCGESRELLTGILRAEWGWEGFVVSDFVFGLRDPIASVRAGLDIEMPFRQQRALALPAAVDGGEVALDDLRPAVERVVATLLRFHELLDRRPDPAVIGSLPHRALARRVSVASTVLLRNEGSLLPVDPGRIGRLAVLGHLADRPNLGDGGSSDVRATTTVTPLAGLRERFGDAAVVHAADDASAVADADLAVVVVGFTKDDEGEYLGREDTAALAASLFPPVDHPELGLGAAGVAPAGGDEGGDEGMARGGDRASLRLRPEDEALIAAVRARTDRVVVAVQAGSAVVMPWAEDVAAILVTWYPGVEGGRALADLLTGEAEPGGRLPVAVPVDEAHLVPFDRDADSVAYDRLHGQWHLDASGIEAHFPFGWGLGYADIELVGAAVVDTVDPAESAAADVVDVTVANTGSRGGSTVVFARARVTGSRYRREPWRLVGFRRVAVAAGDHVTVPVRLDLSQLDVRVDGAWVVERGRYEVEVGRWAGDPEAHVVTIERAGR